MSLLPSPPLHPDQSWRSIALAVLAGLVFTAGPMGHAAQHVPARPTPSEETPDLVTYGHRVDVLRFGSELAQRQGLDERWVSEALQRARYVPAVTRYILPPAAGTAKNWAAYRRRFVEPVRIHAGLRFWEAHAAWLSQAEERYGVPAAIVVGVIGVETLYGRQMGQFRVLDALATLAFDFPAGRKDRSAFFRDELESFLVNCQARDCDPVHALGSFAGATGLPQFMPSSVQKYAVDFDGDGQIDLRGSASDAIGSVAHYLAEFGWRRGLPTHFDVAVPVDTTQRATLLAPDILPTFSLGAFEGLGALVDPAARAAHVRLEASGGLGLLALVELQNGDAATTHVAGTTNFYALTRYNWSSYYAMAVIELGAAVARERERGAR